MQKLDKLINLGIYVWIFLLPWQTRWLARPRWVNNEFWEYGSVSMYLTELIALAVVILFIIKKFKQKQIRNLKFNKNNKLNLVILLLFAWIFASNFFAGDQLIAWTRFLHLALAGLFIFVITKSTVSWQRIAMIIIGAGVLQGYLAIDQFLTQVVTGSSWLGMSEQLPATYGVSVIQYESLRWLRAYGSLPHPNILGSFLSLSLLTLVLMMLKIKKGDLVLTRFNPRLYALAWYGSLFFIFSGLLLSFSRAGWLGTLVGLFILFIIIYLPMGDPPQGDKFHRQLLAPFLKINLIFVLVLLFWFAIAPLPFITRVQGREPLEQQSYEERIKSYTDSKEVTKSYWLQGSGLGNYTSVLIEKNPQAKMSLNQPLHNSWLLVFNELGIIGFILFIGLFYLIYNSARNKLIALAFILPIATLMLFDHFWISLVFGNFFLLFILYFVKKLQFD